MTMRRVRLLTLAEVPFAHGHVFRVATTSLAVTALVLGAVIVAGLYIGWSTGLLSGRHGVLPAGLAWWVLFWLGLFWLFFANDLRKALQPSAWLAVAAVDGLYVKWRSYQNLGWGVHDVQVALVPYGAIAMAQVHRRRWLTPESRHGNTRSEALTHIELQLRDVDTTELAERLAEERAGMPAGIRRSSTWKHFPVSIEPGDVLRLEWRARPGAQALGRCLAERGVPVGEPASSTVDLRTAPSADELSELARRGQVIDLVRVLRRSGSLDLRQAKAEAERLVADATVERRSK